jgi:steroid delta-isomerase-like uncharacterized protein
MRTRIAILAALLAALPLVAVASETPSPTDVVRSMVEAINRRDFDALDALVAPNVIRHSAATPGVEVRNLEEFKEYLKQDLTAVPDAKQTIDRIFGCGSMVAVRAIYRGTQTGPMGPLPPSGREVELPFIGLLRVENGKITEMWVEWDNLTALTQLGHIQPPGGSEAGGDEQ